MQRLMMIISYFHFYFDLSVCVCVCVFRFLRSRLQQDFKLDGVPVRMLIRKSKVRVCVCVCCVLSRVDGVCARVCAVLHMLFCTVNSNRLI